MLICGLARGDGGHYAYTVKLVLSEDKAFD
jgi:hypothetical protein